MSESGENICCLPGDITVTPIYSGFLVGRALPQQGAGPWWQYIKTFGELQEAVTHARQLAMAASVRGWFHEGDTYIQIQLDDSPFPK